MADQRRADHSAFDQTRRRLRLDDRFLASSARVFWPNGAHDPKHRRNPVKRFAHILADPMQLAGAARTNRGLGLDDDLAARQILGKGPDIALWLRPRVP